MISVRSHSSRRVRCVRELEQIGVSERPELVVADAGYWHQAQMETIVNRGVKVLVPPDSRKRKGARPGWRGGAYAFMRRVLQTDAGRELYRKRQAMIEPVFGHTKFNRRIDRFQRRGRSACRSEWWLITAPQLPQAPPAPDRAYGRLRAAQGGPTPTHHQVGLSKRPRDERRTPAPLRNSLA